MKSRKTGAALQQHHAHMPSSQVAAVRVVSDFSKTIIPKVGAAPARRWLELVVRSLFRTALFIDVMMSYLTETMSRH